MTGKAIRALTLGLAAVAVLGSDLSAQRITPYVGGGAAFGTGELAQDTEVGWLMFGGLDVPTPVSGLTVGPAVSHARIPYGGGFSEYEGVTAVLGEVGYGIGGGMPGGIQPFVRAGLGLLINRYDPGSIDTRATTRSGAGVSMGAGLRIPLGGVSALLSGRFTGDIDRGYLSIQAGISLP
jgi:hypothetical protein